MIVRRNHINLESIPAKRNAEGILICLNCDKPLPSRRRKYCCDECSEEWLCKHSHQAMRLRLIQKRGACCQKCGKQIVIDENGIHVTDFSDIVMDHIIPISLGGLEFEEGNLQLLCSACNKIKTALDAKSIATQRMVEKKLVKGQTMLKVSNAE